MALRQHRAACPRHPVQTSTLALRKSRSVVVSRYNVADAVDKLLADASNKEVLLLLMDQDKQLALRDMQAQLKDEQLKAVQTEFKLLRVTSELLHTRGLLHMRGLIKYCESLWLAPGAASAGRLKVWESILQSKPQLLARLQKCLRGKRDYTAVARMIHTMYGNLSGHIHQSSTTAVDIVEGPRHQEQMRVLEGMAQEADVQCIMVYRTAVAVDNVSEEWSDDSESDADSIGDSQSTL